MKSTIYGNDKNSFVTLYRIHQGGCYFSKDTYTEHSQIKLLQSQLNSMGYNCGTEDGKYGDKTVTGVKAFQKANNLTADGLFGQASLEALEKAMDTSHCDSNCENSSDIGAYDCYDEFSSNIASSKYKSSSAMRIITSGDALDRILAFGGEGTPISVEEFLQNLDNIASNISLTYNDKDCAHYVYDARNKQGATGATSELSIHVKYFGSIKDLGGYDKLIPGMQLFQGYRKSKTNRAFYTSHIGVYAGKVKIQGSLMHAVYQSSPSYASLKKKFDKASGPNLTSMSDDWNYWGWSKYIKVR